MPLNAGTRLGSYEVVSLVGSGGMGEVYRARDTKLGRDVAVKILPGAFAGDPERLARFTREAQTLASLNHPNIATIYGVEGNAIIMELLEGATLREELSATPLSTRKAIDWAVQMAHGLAAAHEKGIIHRDLKPENVFVTRDGRVKLLDFGIARAIEPMASDATMTSAGTPPGTEAGVVLGTVGHMSPEQVRGREVDQRSDIFSLGALVYEMLSGRRAFSGESAVETMNAVLTVDPPPLDAGPLPAPPALERIVRRCLEKRPTDRFHSAHDLALALEAISGATTQAIAAAAPPSRPLWPMVVAGIVVAAAAVALAGRWSGRRSDADLPTFRRLTFQRGTIGAARFVPNSTDVVYSATWTGGTPELFTVRSSRPESFPLGQKDATLLGVSPAQDLALMLHPHVTTGQWAGTLASATIAGGGARQIATFTTAADFRADNSVVYAQWDGETGRILDAAGTVIDKAPTPIVNVRVAPTADAVAWFAAGPQKPEIHVRDRAGASKGDIPVGNLTGLAWTPDAKEVVFSESAQDGQTTIFAARPGGGRRVVWRGAGTVAVQDVGVHGSVLVSFVDNTSGVLVQQGDSGSAVDLGWLDDSTAADISPDGDALLLDARVAALSEAAYYIRKLDGSPPVKLGEGSAVAWSPDGQHVLAWTDPTTSVLTPVGPGAAQVIRHPDVTSFFGWFTPEGEILLNGRYRDATAWRFFVMKGNGTARPVGPDGIDHWVGQHVISDDGRLLAVFSSGHNDNPDAMVVPLTGGPPAHIPGFQPTEAIIRFTPDGRHVLAYDRNHLPVKIYSIDYVTGTRTLWREFTPADSTGISGIGSIVISPGGGVVAYNYTRKLSTLYLIDGLSAVQAK